MSALFLNLPGHLVWWSVALILAAAEVLAPGYFLIWIGLGAAATGGLVLLLPQLGVLAQALSFTLLAFLSCAAYWNWLRPRLQRGERSDATTLNRRGASLVGRRLVLAEAHNQKTLLMPMEATGVLGALAGITDLVRSAQSESSARQNLPGGKP